MKIRRDEVQARMRRRVLLQADDKELSDDLWPLVARVADRLLEPGFGATEAHQGIPREVIRRFAGKVGVDVRGYIARWRMEAAKDALVSYPQVKIWRVARLVGYSGESGQQSFSRAFKNHTGLAPREFRKRHEDGEASALASSPADTAEFDATWLRATVGALEPHELAALRRRVTGRDTAQVELRLRGAPHEKVTLGELAEMLRALTPEERRFWLDHVLRIDSSLDVGEHFSPQV